MWGRGGAGVSPWRSLAPAEPRGPLELGAVAGFDQRALHDVALRAGASPRWILWDYLPAEPLLSCLPALMCGGRRGVRAWLSFWFRLLYVSVLGFANDIRFSGTTVIGRSGLPGVDRALPGRLDVQARLRSRVGDRIRCMLYNL